MRNRLLSIVFILGACIVLFACSKPRNLGPQSMTANVNNSPWTATTFLASRGTSYGAERSISISGSSVAGDEIYINLANFKGSGTYDLGTGGENFAEYSNASTDHYARSGQITITGTSGQSLQGNFEFTADSFAIVKYGAFEIAIQ